jgi:tetratricopeptide (TPR) repeat protein
MLNWLDTREAVLVGTALADEYAPQAPAAPGTKDPNALAQLLRQADAKVRPLNLNFFRKAKFANSFKWRLIDKGFSREFADQVTQSLVMHLSHSSNAPLPSASPGTLPERHSSAKRKELLGAANQAFVRGQYTEAIAIYQNLLEIDPRNADAIHNLGAALGKFGLFSESERHLRQAIELRKDFAEAHATLGIVLRGRGENSESEIWLRSAVKLKPNFVDARIHHGITLLALGRLREAKARFAKVLKSFPRHADAQFLTGQVAKLEGRFDEAETRFRRALDINPKMPNAWAALAGTRKMTLSDVDWMKRATEIAESGITPLEEADLRFAIGKYCDDVGDFEGAFRSYKRANELAKSVAESYDRDARSSFVDDMIRVYTPAAVAAVRAGVSASSKPIFVVGMPRSGTSLVEQIVASHPAAKGVGELGFIDDKMLARDSALRRGLLNEQQRKALGEAYLRELEARAGEASRIVDKAPVNSDYLGVIYSVFPNARVVYMQRDPIDSCLSCYFQYFSAAMNFTMDLSDLAHYYRQHQRLMAHWRAVLPPEFILDVPYAELVSDQERWTRKILAFLDLPWDERCLDFHKTERQVVTASTWQVRQKIYQGSVARWRKYEKFIGPLRELKN